MGKSSYNYRRVIEMEHAKNEFSEKLLKESETVTDYVSYVTLRSKMDAYFSALILLVILFLNTWKYLR
jgi:hypothetical protein